MLLAVLQGVSELFPVSSLGHTVLIPALLRWNVDEGSDSFLAFVVVLHLGTALAPVLVVACGASVLGGIGNGTQWASVETAVHGLVDEGFRLRVSALLESMAALAPGVGIVLGGALTTLFSPRAAYLA